MRPASGHDPCIENLPGVINACCGHGIVDGYIQFADGRTIMLVEVVQTYRRRTAA